jgi:hypothetical protein
MLTTTGQRARVANSIIAGQPRHEFDVDVIEIDGDLLTYTTDGVWMSTSRRSAISDWTLLGPVRTVTYCGAHYPLLLDGEAVYCTREPGHEGQHVETNPQFGDMRAWDDQPECWDTVDPHAPSAYAAELLVRHDRIAAGLTAFRAVSPIPGQAGKISAADATMQAARDHVWAMYVAECEKVSAR